MSVLSVVVTEYSAATSAVASTSSSALVTPSASAVMFTDNDDDCNSVVDVSFGWDAPADGAALCTIVRSSPTYYSM